MATLFKRLLAVLLVGGLVGVVAYATLKPTLTTTPAPSAKGNGGPGAAGQRGGGQPVPVLAAVAQRKNVPVVLQGIGTARALQSVLVRPQVDGTIQKLALKEGQEVNAGDLIAELDPSVYKAQLDQAVAKLALTQTQLDNARRDYDRYLKIPGVIAQKTVDTQQALVKQLEAQIKADNAAIVNAQTLLGYTRITAPISGRAGIRLVDEGNLVRAGDAGIVTISQLKPITVQFTLPQQQLAQVNRALAAGRVTVEALDIDGKSVIDTGVLQVVDNQVDAQTGTVRMKAEFPNATQQLWPGQFTTVRVQVDTLNEAVTVPMAAVQRGPSGTFLFVVTTGARVQAKPVTLGLLTETEAVITAGIDAGEQVVTSGFARLTDGAPVTVQAAPDAPPVAPAAQKKRSREGQPKGEARSGGEARGNKRNERRDAVQ